MVGWRQVEIPFLGVTVDIVEVDSVHLHKSLGEPPFHFYVNFLPQSRNVWVLTCWNLVCQQMQMLLVVEKIQDSCKECVECKLSENSWVVVAESEKEQKAERSLRTGDKRTASFHQNLQNRPVGRGETFLQLFPIGQIEQFSVPNSCDSFWDSWRENTSSWRCHVIARTRNSSC